jgi:hypothetical protein
MTEKIMIARLEKTGYFFPLVTLCKYHNAAVEKKTLIVSFHLNPELFRD